MRITPARENYLGASRLDSHFLRSVGRDCSMRVSPSAGGIRARFDTSTSSETDVDNPVDTRFHYEVMETRLQLPGLLSRRRRY